MRLWKMLIQALPSSGKCRGALVMSSGALIVLALIGALSGCAAGLSPLSLQPTPELFITARFGPDGRLWRLRPTGGTLYVEYSTDLGRSFSTPMAVNRQPQHLKAVAEDRPQLAVDRLGRIYVIYYAEGPYPVTVYLSYSLDGGQSFSTPVVLSQGEPQVEHSMATLVSDSAARVHLFWLEDRPGGEPGASLYYTSADGPNGLIAPNQKVNDSLCECCRLRVDFEAGDRPVVFARLIFPDSIRDHGLLKMSPEGGRWSAQRVSEDDWRIEACPRHGPALSIAPDGRYHIAWFTQGSKHQGLFYAYSDDGGRHFSSPIAFGNPELLAQHPDVLALGERVVLVWKEFDGTKTRIMAMQSRTRGSSWLPPSQVAESDSESDHPLLITDGKRIFASWNSMDHGHRVMLIE